MCGEGESGVIDDEAEVVLLRDLGPVKILSDSSQFSLREVACIHDFISLMQLVRVE